MKIGFLITARLKSTRLPLKLLLPLNGYTVIERVIHRAKSVTGCEDVVLCTSTQHQDLPLVRIAQQNDIYYFTGHPEDVLQRLLDAGRFFDIDFFVGITADNPLFSIYHANMLVDMVRSDHSLDFVYTEGMPIGLNIYAMNVKALETICAVKEQVDTEIWGYLIKRPEVFQIRKIDASQQFIRRDYRLTLDEFDDYSLFRWLFSMFPSDRTPDVLEAYDVLDAHPEAATLNQKVVQRDLDESVKKAIDDFFKTNLKSVLRVKASVYNRV